MAGDAAEANFSIEGVELSAVMSLRVCADNSARN